jgi:hypothetical protein
MLVGRRCHPVDATADRGSHDIRAIGHSACDDDSGDVTDNNSADVTDNNSADDNADDNADDDNGGDDS